MKNRITYWVIALVGLISGCGTAGVESSHANGSEATSNLPQSVAASAETRSRLGVEQWSVGTSTASDDSDVHTTTAVGEDAEGGRHVELSVRVKNDPSVASWLELSVTTEQQRVVARIFRQTDGTVTTEGTDAMRNAVEARAVIARLAADLKAEHASGSLHTAALRPLTLPLVRTTNPFDDCMELLNTWEGIGLGAALDVCDGTV